MLISPVLLIIPLVGCTLWSPLPIGPGPGAIHPTSRNASSADFRCGAFSEVRGTNAAPLRSSCDCLGCLTSLLQASEQRAQVVRVRRPLRFGYLGRGLNV